MADRLPTRPLGGTGIEITAVGFGAWAIGGLGWEHAWGPQDDADSIAAIQHAVDRGVNWIDTAPVYGHGHSEEVVGRALRRLGADRPYVFTKAGLIWDAAHHMRPPARDASHVRWELEHSLRRLGLERVDLLQVHWPALAGADLAEYWQTMIDLLAEGKVRAVGLSNFDVVQLETAEKIGHVDSLQPPLSLLRRDAAGAEIPWCAVHGTGVIAYSPMESGLLSGGFSAERAAGLPQTDWRRTAPDFTGDALRRNLALVDAVRPVAARHGVPVAAVVVAWTLAWPGVTGAIVGARRPDQIDGWLPAASLRLTDADLDEIAAAIVATGAGTGPVRPPRVGS
ncbi:MAG TPA: aldo/keto reductase [Pilimelia sp.]|nr:aldo/keto reductase [Pilimelia sp.]